MMSELQPLPATSKGLDELECVRGRIGFARRTPDENAPSAPTPMGHDFPMVMYDVPVRNARPIVDGLSLDREGFVVVKHSISCALEPDPDVFRRKYVEEVTPFIQDYFKASWVTSLDLGGATLRSVGGNIGPRAGASAALRVSRPFGAAFAHIDYASEAGPMIAARDNQLLGNEIRAYSRLMIIQTWRALSPPPQNFPLAFCDSTSIAQADLFNTYYRNHGVTHKTWYLHHNAAQRWYYLPDMTADELFLFKGYDSLTHHRPWSAHAAFDNTANRPEAKPRESIEARFYVYYE
jgi:hypothetical protein